MTKKEMAEALEAVAKSLENYYEENKGTMWPELVRIKEKSIRDVVESSQNVGFFQAIKILKRKSEKIYIDIAKNKE